MQQYTHGELKGNQDLFTAGRGRGGGGGIWNGEQFWGMSHSGFFSGECPEIDSGGFG